MKTFATSAIAASLFLVGCGAGPVTETEPTPLPVMVAPFSGTVTGIDKTQSSVSFIGKSSLVNHEGRFEEYSANIALDPAEPANLEKASVEAVVTVASVKTDSTGLDGHLQKDDFFAAAIYPTVTFVSKSIAAKGDNMYEITGDLTAKGVTKTVTIPAEITDTSLTANFDFPRKDFGIGNDSYGDKLLDPLVPVTVNLTFTK